MTGKPKARSRSSTSVPELRVALYHDLPSGGAKRVLHEQARGLRARGHVVDAFLPATAEEAFLPLDGVTRTVRTFFKTTPPDREKALRGRVSPADLARWGLFLRDTVQVDRRIACDLDAEGYDVVLVHPSQFTQAPLLLRWLDTPSLYYCHEPLRAAHEPRIATGPVRFVLRHTLGRLDRGSLRRASILVANSRFTAERLARFSGVFPEIVHPGVDASAFRPLKLRRENFVLSVGGLHPLKGFDFLIESVGHVATARRPSLLLVSDRARRSERDRLERLATERGVTVRFQLRVEEAELVRLYNQAKAVVYAPHNEPFGLVPLEAMASGTPVLAVAEGGVLETVEEGQTGFLCPRDAVRFGLRLEEIIGWPEPVRRVVRSARRAVLERWTWERSVDRLEVLLGKAARPRIGAR